MISGMFLTCKSVSMVCVTLLTSRMSDSSVCVLLSVRR